MKSDPPALENLQKSASRIRDLYAQDPDLHEWWTEIWSEVLRLIYSGNMHAARQYFDLAWPKERNDKNEVVDDFRKTLAGSPYSRDVLAMNNGESF